MILVALTALLASCASRQPLVVKQFTLRDAGSDYNEDPMIRGEKLRRLHGAIGVNEQAQRLGQYYDVIWSDASTGAPAEIVFEYQQGATGSRVKRQTKQFDASATAGKAEFAIIGDNYTKGGKVLAWRISLRRGGQEIASRRSYLWQ
ncbi:hypothetical protein llg_08900 [Luteolibacter sp. LG18]|nr:hypothetical protein llg_08900 [Luteolibacter sp. LG18]